MKPDTLEKLKQISDRVDNLIHAMQIPIPAHKHLEGLKGSLPEIKRQIDKICKAEEN
jgi:hypothetical protein